MRTRRQKQSPISLDAACPQCGSVNIYRVHRRKGEHFRLLGAPTGYCNPSHDGKWRAHHDHQENQCRDCQKTWGNRLAAVEGLNSPVGIGVSTSKATPLASFRVEAMLPVLYCSSCTREYTVLFRGTSDRTKDPSPCFCPYCGEEPKPSQAHEDWLSKLREDSLKAFLSGHNPSPGQTDPTLGSSGSESTQDR